MLGLQANVMNETMSKYHNLSAEKIQVILEKIIDPFTGQGLLVNKALVDISVTEKGIKLSLQKGYPAGYAVNVLGTLITEALSASVGELVPKTAVKVIIDPQLPEFSRKHSVKAVDGVANIICVASGKGGVGKSTVSANLALALAKQGAKVGMLDADIYGPSQPKLFGLQGKPEMVENKMTPLENYGVQVMSIGLMVDPDSPMIWRGPMVTQALEQLLQLSHWDDLDYLIMDLPPGTGDIQLTLSQKVPIAGSVIITTPQDLSLIDAVKAVKMFEKVEVPILGLVENMSTHICSNCHHEEAIFGEGGGEVMAEEYKLPFLGSIPLTMAIRKNADEGNPTVVAEPDSAAAVRYHEIALKVAGRLSARKKDYKSLFPNIEISNT